MLATRCPGNVSAGCKGMMARACRGALDKTNSQKLPTLGNTFILQLTKGKGNFPDSPSQEHVGMESMDSYSSFYFWVY